jgi:hypothetical protein
MARDADGSEAVGRDAAERQALAEQWRVLGEKLRERSPAAFEDLIANLAASVLPDDEGDPPAIDQIYSVC